MKIALPQYAHRHDHSAEPLQLLLRQEQIERVGAALASLRVVSREALLLRHVDELPFDQVGQQLGRSAEAARKLCKRGEAELRARLEDERAMRTRIVKRGDGVKPTLDQDNQD
jgi:RNA polymerase sigma factor (sigma-70 family)